MGDDIYKKIFSRNLRYYMNLQNKTQIDVINNLGINKSAISTWVNGTRLPRMDKVDLLAKYLGCTRSDLIEDHQTSSTPTAPADPDADYFISEYRKLDTTDRIIIKSTVSTLLNADKYKKGTESSSA